MWLEKVPYPNSWFIRIYQYTKAKLLLFLIVPLLFAGTGCSFPSNLTSLSSPLELTIRQVESSDRPGVYTVSGRTSLPENTQITVSAIRYFKEPAFLGSEGVINPDYAILDRQFAEVEQGNWQTSLNLWQVAPDGRFQEVWQLNTENSGIQLEPEPDVTFLATLDPPNQPANLQSQVESQDESTQVALVRFTTEGEVYLQANKTMPIALPVGSTTPPAASPAPLPRRSNLEPTDAPMPEVVEESSASWSQTDAPLSPDQMLR